jgi:phosphatidylethanolamine/phosphatidyl-N-methylethanolamine N-methyltransferase
MMRAISDSALYFREFCGRFETTGSIIPSSPFLARAITRPVRERGPEPVRILECGPGTGPFTNLIVRSLRPHDVFDIVEVNPAFVKALNSRFAVDKSWSSVRHFTSIYEMTLQEFVPQAPYDFIISGLPHINFPEQVVAEIIDIYNSLLKPGGTLSYFEYMYIRPIRKIVTLGVDRHRVRNVDRLMNSHLRQHFVIRNSIFLNLPPAWVQHVRRQEESSQSATIEHIDTNSRKC